MKESSVKWLKAEFEYWWSVGMTNMVTTHKEMKPNVLYYLLYKRRFMFLVALVCLSVCEQRYSTKVWTDCNEILWKGLRWYNEELIKFW